MARHKAGVLGEKGKKTVTESLAHTEELQAEIVMERSESSHRSWEPNNSRVLVEGWPCCLGHARLPELVLGKCVHCFGSRVLSPVFTYRNFLRDGNHYYSLIHHRQTTPALSSRKINRQDRLGKTKSDELLTCLPVPKSGLGKINTENYAPESHITIVKT